MDLEGYCLNNELPDSSYLGIIGSVELLELYLERLTSTIYLDNFEAIVVKGKSFTSKSNCQSV